jgi:hypothetical protein
VTNILDYYTKEVITTGKCPSMKDKNCKNALKTKIEKSSKK